jgi:hypothetical protein
MWAVFFHNLLLAHHVLRPQCAQTVQPVIPGLLSMVRVTCIFFVGGFG